MRRCPSRRQTKSVQGRKLFGGRGIESYRKSGWSGPPIYCAENVLKPSPLEPIQASNKYPIEQ